MNRLFTLLAVALTISLSSCMKSTKYEPSPVQGGINIYNSVNNTNVISLDPLNIAIRLNTLIYDAKQNATADLNNVIVKDDKDKEYNVKTALFGAATIILKTGTKYSITYQSGYESQTDLNRRGTFFVETTNDKNLYEEEARWTVTMGTGTEAANTKPYIYGGSSGNNIYYGESSYSLSNYGAGTIEVNGTYSGYVKEEYKADWTVHSTISLYDAKGLISLKGAEKITIDYTSSGKLLNSTALSTESSISTYTALDYKPSCGISNIQSGKITARFPDLKVTYPQDHPSDVVTVEWTAGTSCRSTIDVTYNGFTERLN